jgi:hypothetical protein
LSISANCLKASGGREFKTAMVVEVEQSGPVGATVGVSVGVFVNVSVDVTVDVPIELAESGIAFMVLSRLKNVSERVTW